MSESMMHNSEHLRSLAKQLRDEAERAEAKANKLETKQIFPPRDCPPGCWNTFCTCIYIQDA